MLRSVSSLSLDSGITSVLSLRRKTWGSRCALGFLPSSVLLVLQDLAGLLWSVMWCFPSFFICFEKNKMCLPREESCFWMCLIWGREENIWLLLFKLWEREIEEKCREHFCLFLITCLSYHMSPWPLPLISPHPCKTNPPTAYVILSKMGASVFVVPVTDAKSAW